MDCMAHFTVLSRATLEDEAGHDLSDSKGPLKSSMRGFVHCVNFIDGNSRQTCYHRMFYLRKKLIVFAAFVEYMAWASRQTARRSSTTTRP